MYQNIYTQKTIEIIWHPIITVYLQKGNTLFKQAIVMISDQKVYKPNSRCLAE